MPSFPALSRVRRGKLAGLLRRPLGSAGRWGPGVVQVAGPSMLPTLAPGDACLVWWSPRTRPRPGRVVVARLPGRPGMLAVKRVTCGRDAARDAAWWLEGDNPAASTDSWRVGAVAGQDVVAWVLARYWPRPGLLRPPRPYISDGVAGHRRAAQRPTSDGGTASGRAAHSRAGQRPAAADSSSAR